MILVNVIAERCSLRIGIVTTNGMQDMDLILQELLAGDFQWSMTGFDISTLDAIIDIGQL